MRKSNFWQLEEVWVRRKHLSLKVVFPLCFICLSMKFYYILAKLFRLAAGVWYKYRFKLFDPSWYSWCFDWLFLSSFWLLSYFLFLEVLEKHKKCLEHFFWLKKYPKKKPKAKMLGVPNLWLSAYKLLKIANLNTPMNFKIQGFRSRYGYRCGNLAKNNSNV